MDNFFVRRPIVAMVIAIFMVIIGTVFLSGLPIEQYPNITPPMVLATILGVFFYPMLFVFIGKIAKYEQKRDSLTQQSGSPPPP